MSDEPKNYWRQDEPEVPVVNSEPVTYGVQQPVQPVQPPAPEQPHVAPQPQPLAQPTQQLPPQPAQEAFEAEQQPQLPTAEPITWSAEEYVHPDKGAMWYVVLTLVALAFIAIDIFFLKSYTFSALVVVMFIALIVYIRRPARTLTYSLSPAQGLYVGDTLHSFDEFKAFGVIQDATHHSILLIPRKRFAVGVSVFFPAEAGEAIVDILGQRLPMENLKLDVVDAIVRKLRL